MRWLLTLFAAAILGHPSAGAQSIASVPIRVELGRDAPLAGALVALVDANDRITSETLSNAGGRVTLRALPGKYRVRVRRIGFRPFYSGLLDVPQNAESVIRVESPRVVLTSMVVSARAHCGRIDADAESLSQAWEEISKALRASQLTATDLSAIGKSIVFRRDLRSNGTTISADTTVRPAAAGRPFASRDPNALVRDGYVWGNPLEGWEYFGPDEAVLLSRGFAETHCFRIVRDRKRKGDLGVAFEPAPNRKKSDIAGVVWLDERTSELEEITFRFVNVYLIDKVENGGYTRFRRMPSGAWIVDDWLLRVPKLESRTGRPTEVFTIGFIENGGKVIDL